MATDGVFFTIDGEDVVQTLQRVQEKLGTAEGELVLDLSSVRRLDPSAVRVMENIASNCNDNTRVVLRGVNVDIYKVLKLIKLAPRFSFLA